MRRETTVGQLMTTALLFLHEKDSLEQAHVSMRAAGVRHIPVVDTQGHVVGILSDRDILRAMAEDTLERSVSTAMTRSVLTVHPWTPAHEAARILIEHKIGSLPVIEDDETLVGIVTETDFLRVACEALGGASPRL